MSDFYCSCFYQVVASLEMEESKEHTAAEDDIEITTNRYLEQAYAPDQSILVLGTFLSYIFRVAFFRPYLIFR